MKISRTNPTVTHQSVVVAAPSQVSVDFDGEAIILNVQTGIYYALPKVGGRIWDLLQAPIPVEQIRDAIQEQYDVGREQCERDLLNLLDKLLDTGLIELCSPATN